MRKILATEIQQTHGSTFGGTRKKIWAMPLGVAFLLILSAVAAMMFAQPARAQIVPVVPLTGQITVAKETDPADASDIFTFTVTGDSVAPFVAHLSDNMSATATLLPSGVYTVSESNAPGWSTLSFVCVDDDTGIPVGPLTFPPSPSAQFTLDPGQHVTCTGTNGQQGQIRLIKETQPVTSTETFTFSFAGAFVGASIGSLQAGETMTFTGLPPSDYQLGEVQLPEGWGAVSLVCVDDVTGDEVAASTGGAGVTVPLAGGQYVTCTAINALLGQITVAKETDPADASDLFTFTVSGDNITPFTASLSDNMSATATSLLPGVYTVGESNAPGWATMSFVCVDDATGIPVGPLTFPPSPSATFTLEPGQHVTCTGSNALVGQIRLIKATQPVTSTETFTFSFAGIFVGAYVAPIQAGETMTFTGLPPSGYQLGEEQLPTGWGAVSLVCVDDVTGDEVVSSTGGAGVNVPLEAGQKVTCTAINALLGQITVAKETDPADASDVFTFTVSGDNIIPFTASLSDNMSATATSLLPGVYTVGESNAPGWATMSFVCVDDATGDLVAPLTLPASPSATFTLEPGQHVTCTGNNALVGQIRLIKETQPVTSTETFTFSFTGALVGAYIAPIQAGQTMTFTGLPPSDYQLSEDQLPPGWFAMSMLCVDDDTGEGVVASLPGASVTVPLNAGQRVTCTAINAQLGQINLIKQTDPVSATQTFSYSFAGGLIGAFIGEISAGQTITQPHLPPGIYSIAEFNLPSDWRVVSLTCTDVASGESTVYPGDGANVELEPSQTLDCVLLNHQLTASIAVTKAVGVDPASCAAPGDLLTLLGTPVYYCVTVQNTGDVTLTHHTVDDPALGVHAELDMVLAPGQVVTLTHAEIAALGPVTVTADITNTVTVTATGERAPGVTAGQALADWEAVGDAAVTAWVDDNANDIPDSQETLNFHLFLPAVSLSPD